MCLYTNKNIEKSNKKIACYKVVKYNKKEDRYFTPYRNCVIDSKVVNGEEAMEVIGDTGLVPSIWSDYRKVAERGFIHCFVNKQDAFSERNYWINNITNNNFEVKIFECVIPEDTEYVNGFFIVTDPAFNEIKYKSIAARKIKFVKEIDIK